VVLKVTPSPSNIETLKLNNSGTAFGHFSCPSLYYPRSFQGFIWLILAKRLPSWRSLYSDRSQTLRAFVAVFPHYWTQQHHRYCKTENKLMEVKKKRKTWRMLRWKYTVHVTARLTNRRLFWTSASTKAVENGLQFGRNHVLCVNSFSTGAMSSFPEL